MQAQGNDIMETYLERYLQDERLAVWTELVGLGGAVRSEPLHSDARAVAAEMMRRAKHNIALLVERLHQMDYRFVYPDRVWTAPDAALLAALDALEKRFGPFPLAVRTWFESVGVVNFMGTHPRLSSLAGKDWGGSDKLRCYSDPMMVMMGGPGGLLPFYINRADSEEEESRMESEMPTPYGLEIGLSAIDKAGHSGSGSVAMLVPNPAFDAPIIDSDLVWMGTFFVPYLRTCFEWGGFPGLRLKTGIASGDSWDPAYSKTEVEFLTKDLLPL